MTTYKSIYFYDVKEAANVAKRSENFEKFEYHANPINWDRSYFGEDLNKTAAAFGSACDVVPVYEFHECIDDATRKHKWYFEGLHIAVRFKGEYYRPEPLPGAQIKKIC